MSFERNLEFPRTSASQGKSGNTSGALSVNCIQTELAENS